MGESCHAKTRPKQGKVKPKVTLSRRKIYPKFKETCIMKKKSLRPIQTAPVQRDTTATSASSHVGLAASTLRESTAMYPFAGDDAE
ncbi:anacyclamide/piricyclamide family prenylated cyclic peptide [Lyngbya sp. CCAP 1446/10]|nr:anacyclamide/piricyclamide family prenylated cyclic peptide [Lyngbya sp. CCAP 1446/10]